MLNCCNKDNNKQTKRESKIYNHSQEITDKTFSFFQTFYGLETTTVRYMVENQNIGSRDKIRHRCYFQSSSRKSVITYPNQQ